MSPPTCPIASRAHQLAVLSLLALLVAASSPTQVLASELEGFTEPHRTIQVASDESGIVDQVLAEEGDRVDAGQPLVQLNCDVHLALLAIADQSMKATGRRDAAAADLDLRRERLAKLEELRVAGHARQEEVDRARGELAIAEANLRATDEELATKRLEHERIRAQVARRTVRAPVSGVVTRLHKQRGEFVAPNNPEILTLVELDLVVATFTAPSQVAARLRNGQSIQVHFPATGRQTSAEIVHVSPVTDAESGTVRVKARIANTQGDIRCGERCTAKFPD